MAVHTDEEHLENLTTNQLENSPEEIPPSIDIETINPNQELENMEIHKHPHHVTHKKKWGEYMLEFFMLFLAVFLGFLAENIREHNVEKDREKEYMVTLLEDLKSDTALLKHTVKYWENINYNIDSVTDAIQLPLSNIDLRKTYKHINNALDYFSFSYNQRTTVQLKNAGGFRLLRNKIVANKIIDYDQFNNDAITNIAIQHHSFFETVVKLRNKLFVQDISNKIYKQYRYNLPPHSADLWIDSLINNYRIPVHAETQLELMFEFKNAILSYRQDYTNMKWGYDNLFKKQLELILLISKEYHLE
ncbi:MAG: hypothetical protein WCR66_07705 [Bacteroidota bacterium]